MMDHTARELHLELHRLLGRMQERHRIDSKVDREDDGQLAQVVALTLIAYHLRELAQVGIKTYDPNDV